MNALIDTEALLRWLTDDPSLPQPVRDAIADFDTEIGVSSASLYEVAAKVRQGMIALDINQFTLLLNNQGFTLLTAGPSIMARAGAMAWQRTDPWDRIIAATALDLAVPLISANPEFDQTGVDRRW